LVINNGSYSGTDDFQSLLQCWAMLTAKYLPMIFASIFRVRQTKLLNVKQLLDRACGLQRVRNEINLPEL